MSSIIHLPKKKGTCDASISKARISDSSCNSSGCFLFRCWKQTMGFSRSRGSPCLQCELGFLCIRRWIEESSRHHLKWPPWLPRVWHFCLPRVWVQTILIPSQVPPPPSKGHWRKWSFSMSRFRSQMAVSIAAPGWCWKNCCKRSDQHGPTSLDPTWQRAVEATALVQQGDKYARETPHTPSSAFPKAMGAKWAHLGCKVLLENLLSHGTLSQDTICETAPGAPLLP